MQKVITLLSILFLTTSAVIAQKSISGVVIGDDGEPIPGASVIIQGTTTGTVTDYDGRYTIEAQEGQVLVFNFIGLVGQEVQVGEATTYDVTLSDDTKMVDEIIVVAYGTAKKSSFTGSAAQVKAEKIENRSVSNVMQTLSGSIAGVQINNESGQPGSEPQIKIRGIGSINASTKPLYVVDGVPYEGNIAAINPQDIESMSVLKDAASSAIYGARGANGVVLITTKKGQGNHANINIDARWGVNSRGVPNYEVMSDPAMYLETYYRALYNSRALTGSSTASAHKYANDNLISDLGYQIYTVPEGERLIGTNFKLNPNATLGYYDGEYYYTPDDWEEEMFIKNNLRQEYNISVSGASDRLNYYLSFGYLDDSGIVNNTDFKRYTTRIKGDYQAKDWVKFGANISYTYYNSGASDALNTWGSGRNAFYVANLMAPIYPMYYRNKEGEILYDEMGNKRYDFGSKRAFMNSSNPAAIFELDKRNAETDNLSGKWSIALTPIEGLNISANYGVDLFNERYNQLDNPFYGSSVSSKGYVFVSHFRKFSINQQYLLTYKKTLGDIHNIDFLIGYESFSMKHQTFSGDGSLIYNPTVAELGNSVDPDKTADSDVLKYATQGILSRIQYDFAGKYFLSGSFRRDASSCFHPDNRWGNFGSAGAAWLINKESFLDNVDIIDVLKLKASFGVQGNDNLGRDSDNDTYSTWAYTPYQDIYSVSYSGDPDNPYSVAFIQKGNKDITWESNSTINAGVDFELFDGRLSGSLEYFWRKTSDMLYNLPVPTVLGYSTTPMNVGDIVNKGFEFDINGVVVKGDKFDVSINVNGTTYKNEITDLHESVRENGFVNRYDIYRVGGSVYNSYMPRYAGVDKATGEALYYYEDSDGTLKTTNIYENATKFDLGCTLPKIFGGFGLTFDGYGFDFTAQLSYQLGGKIYDGTYEELMHTGYSTTRGYNWHKDILKAWTPENPDTDVPRLCSSDPCYQLASDRFLTKSDYISFNNVVLGYTLPNQILGKLSIQRLRVYVTCDNVALWSKRKGLDPRQELGNGEPTTSGNFSYSALRSISGGIQITF